MKTLIFETGVSNYHRFIRTMLRSTSVNGELNKIFCTCYKICDNEKFEEELKKQLLLNRFTLHLNSF